MDTDMVESDSYLDLGNSGDEDDEEDEGSEDKEDLEPTDEVSAKKNLIKKSESCHLYTIQEEEERDSNESSRNYSDISRLELYFRQLSDCSNK